MNSNIKCVLFDFDGVIADTEMHNAEYLARALSELGVTMSEEEKRQTVGVSYRVTAERLLERAPQPASWDMLQEIRAKNGNFYENGKELKALPGAVETVSDLRKQGFTTGLVSSTRTMLIVTALNRLKMTRLFDVIVCGDMIKNPKPDPECYIKAMDLLGIKPEECMVIEDSPVGIAAAKQAGITTVAYKGAEPRQNTAGADYTIDNFHQLFEMRIL